LGTAISLKQMEAEIKSTATKIGFAIGGFQCS